MPPTYIIPKQARASERKSRRKKCGTITVKDVLYKYACPDCCSENGNKVSTPTSVTHQMDDIPAEKPDDMTVWSWKLKQQRFGAPPSKSQFRTAKFRVNETQEVPCEEDCPKRKYVNPFRTKKKSTLSGAQKRKIIERWGKLWDSALSDLQFDRTVFENNPDGEQMSSNRSNVNTDIPIVTKIFKRKCKCISVYGLTFRYKNDNERINDGCGKLCAIAKMNQNIITMMMKKFVSGPPGKLYTLNRIEAAQCWSRIINDQGLVNDHCCVDLPVQPTRRKFNIASLNTPKALRKEPHFLKRMSTYRLPLASKRKPNPNTTECSDRITSTETTFKKNPTYWLDPNLVPPVPPGFREEEFHLEPKFDPTGEIRRELMKAKETAKRYTRFAHIIERAVHVIPNLNKINRAMDEHFVARDPQVRRQTLLHNFFSSPKIETSPEFKRDALYATILSRNDNPKGTVVKAPFPYSLAEMSKSKSSTYLRSRV